MYYRTAQPLVYFSVGLFFGCVQEKLSDNIRDELVCVSLDAYYATPEAAGNTMIHIFGTNIAKHGTIKEDSFINSPDLTVLALSSCVNNIEIGAFNGLDKLKHLVVEANYLPVIKGECRF